MKTTNTNTSSKISVNQPKKSPSLFLRGLVAVTLFFGFYILALAVIATLLGFIYISLFHSRRIQVKLVLFAAIGAGTVLWSILPRFDKFVSFGPKLEPDAHPEFFNILGDIAKASGQSIPKEVYLEMSLNAWVSYRGGIMGLGSRKIMGIGLPLMVILTKPELAAVIAHEFGHYNGGDVSLGPWIYKTRGSLERTLQHLGAQGSRLHSIFLAYGRLFMRITNKISRSQEYSADQFSADFAGASEAKSVLLKLGAYGSLPDIFWKNQLSPVLAKGFYIPYAAAFKEYCQREDLASYGRTQLDEALKEEETAYHTHPSIKNRLKALGILDTESLPVPEIAISDSSLETLNYLSDLEASLFDSVARVNNHPGFKMLPLSEVVPQVYTKIWNQNVQESLNYIGNTAFQEFVADPDFIFDFGKKFTHIKTEQELDYTVHILGSALGLALVKNGWPSSIISGGHINFFRNGMNVMPFKLIRDYCEKKISFEEWSRQITSLDLGDLKLSDIAAN